MDIWKEIEGFENYQVSNLGKVRNLKGLILSYGMANGYQRVGLYDVNKKRTNLYVHRLVAAAFHENPENKPEVNHINGIKTYNLSSNLEWVTSKENKIHSYKTGLSMPVDGEKNGQSKLSEKEVLEIRSRYGSKSISQRELSRQYNVSQCMINNIVNNINWKCL